MRSVVIGLFALVLTGCTSAGWDHSFAFLDDPPKPAAPPPRQSAAPDPGWCAEVATAAKTEAAEHGFDAATQARRSDAIYAQCVGKK